MRYSLVLLAVLWATGPVSAATWADGLFNELSHDFGSVPRGRSLVHGFQITNNTRSNLQISRVRVSCGCVRAGVKKTSLQPGESTQLIVQMETSRYTGVRTSTVYVEFTQPSVQEVRLWVRANSRNDFAVTPETLAFGHVKPGTTPTSSTRITFYGNSGARVVSVKSESNYIQPKCIEVSRAGTQVVYNLTARLRSDIPVGRWYSDIWLKTNLPNIPQVRVPLTVTVESTLSVSPQTVILGNIQLGASSERRIIVRGVRPFQITKVVGGDEQVSAGEPSPRTSRIHVLTVRLSGRRAGNIDRMLRIMTNLKGENSIDFRVTGTVETADGSAPKPTRRSQVLTPRIPGRLTSQPTEDPPKPQAERLPVAPRPVPEPAARPKVPTPRRYTRPAQRPQPTYPRRMQPVPVPAPVPVPRAPQVRPAVPPTRSRQAYPAYRGETRRLPQGNNTKKESSSRLRRWFSFGRRSSESSQKPSSGSQSSKRGILGRWLRPFRGRSKSK